MSTSSKEAIQEVKREVDDEDAKEDAEELLRETSKSAKEQGKAMATVTAPPSNDQVPQLDQAKAQQALTALSQEQDTTRERRLVKQRELEAVQVRQEDIDLVANEFELGQDKAERYLRMHRGDLVATLRALL